MEGQHETAATEGDAVRLLRWWRKRRARKSAERVREIEAEIARLDSVIHEPIPEPPPPYRPRLNWEKCPDGGWKCNGQRIDVTPASSSSAYSLPSYFCERGLHKSGAAAEFRERLRKLDAGL